MSEIIQYEPRMAAESGITNHPQKQVEELGMKVLKFKGLAAFDCIIMEVENVPEELPKYIFKTDSWMVQDDYLKPKWIK